MESCHHEQDWEIIQLSFGLEGREKQTLQEIGDSLGISTERVRQREYRAIEILRCILLGIEKQNDPLAESIVHEAQSMQQAIASLDSVVTEPVIFTLLEKQYQIAVDEDDYKLLECLYLFSVS